MRPRLSLVALLFSLLLLPAAASAQSLKGGTASLDRQNAAARAHDFTYLRDPAQVRRFVSAGYLVPVQGNENFRLHDVSFPYTRPEVLTFIERLSQQYRAACGEQLVVTSLTRPSTHQPANASARSVHPTGMAVDLRLPSNTSCRAWLEKTLLSLEKAGVLEATRERWPPHYHVAVFPKPYMQYVQRITRTQTVASADKRPASKNDATPYVVRRGDSLWAVARRHGTTVEALKAENGLKEPLIYAGQMIRIPARQ